MAIRGSSLAGAIIPVSGPAGIPGQKGADGKDGLTQDISGLLAKNGDASATSVTLADGSTPKTAAALDATRSSQRLSLALLSGLGALSTITAKDIIIPAGTWPVQQNLTVPGGFRLILERGALLNLAAGVTLAINCEFEAPCARVFSGPGVVQGIADVRPEWWGASGDGVTDDAVPVQAAVDCSTSVTFSSSAKMSAIRLRRGARYGSTRQITLAPTSIRGLRLVGSDPVFGARLVALPGFDTSGGSALLRVLGQTDSGQSPLALELSGFALENQSGSACQFGLSIGGTSAVGGGNIQPLVPNAVHDIGVYGFPGGVRLAQARRFHFTRVDVWNDQVANSIAWLVTMDRPGGTGDCFTGDFVWSNCQSVPHATTGTCLKVYCDQAGGQLKGLRLNDVTWASSLYGLFVQAKNGAAVGDIFINPGLQNDGPLINSIYVNADGTNASASPAIPSLVENIKIFGMYIRGVQGGSGPVIIKLEGTNGGFVNCADITYCFISDISPTTSGIIIGAGCRNVNFDFNTLQGFHNGNASPINIFSPYCSVRGNRLHKSPYDLSTVQSQYMISFTTGLSWLAIHDNISGGLTTAGIVQSFDTPPNSNIRNNI